jgi:hypothetical protein
VINREQQRRAAILALEISEAAPIWIAPVPPAPPRRSAFATGIALSTVGALLGAGVGALFAALLAHA